MSTPVPAEVLAEVAAAGAADAGGLSVELLGDFLSTLTAAVAAGRPLTRRQLQPYPSYGDTAARQGVALRALLDLYSSAAWRLWRHLPAVEEAHKDPAAVVTAGEVMLRAVDDVASVLRRASGFGLRLSGPHAVAVVLGERPFADGTPLIGTMERAVLGSKGDADALVASKEGRLIVVFPAPDRAAVSQVLAQLSAALGPRSGTDGWQIGVGRPGTGADGVVSSYQEARDALDLSARLGLDDPVVDARELLVYHVLLRDRTAITDLVDTLLTPLLAARGGAGPLLDTLAAYFNSGGNTAQTARTLHLSVRAVTYRLARVHVLTGHDPAQPSERFVLQVAVLGAKLLDWPDPPLN